MPTSKELKKRKREKEGEIIRKNTIDKRTKKWANDSVKGFEVYEKAKKKRDALLNRRKRSWLTLRQRGIE